MSSMIIPNEKNLGFGHQMLSYFPLEKGYININHGSYGCTPNEILEAKANYQKQMDSNPDRWFRYELLPKYNNTVKNLSEYIHADPSDVVLIDNASTGVNAVLRSYDFNPGDRIMYFDIAYPMVKKSLQYVKDRYQVVLVPIKTDQKMFESKKSMLTRIESAIQDELKINNNSLSMALLDHITSLPAIVLPINEICHLFRKLCPQTTIVVDGAHALGNVDINIKVMKPDVYISNGHKWLYSPKCSAFMYVASNIQGKIHPAIISIGYQVNFQEEFQWTGTRDYASYLCISDALHFRGKIGGDEKIRSYIHELAKNATAYLVKLWNSECLVPEIYKDENQDAQNNKCDHGFMRNVRLPVQINSMDRASKLTELLMKQYNTYMHTFEYDGKYWARLSFQIYLELSDFIKIGEGVLSLCSTME